MATAIKTKTVHYRKCLADEVGGAPSTSFDLEAQIRKASKLIKRPWIRKIGISGDQCQFLIYLLDKQTCLCGTLASFSAGRKIPLIDALDDGTSWEDTVDPKDSKGKIRKLQDHALYFAIRKNHVAVIQTRELDTKDLNDFLVWFIQTQAQQSIGSAIFLQNLPSQEAIQKLKDRKITGVSIGQQAFVAVKTPLTEEEKQKAKGKGRAKKYRTEIQSDPRAMEFLKCLLGDNAILEDLNNCADPGSIHLGIDISYRSRGIKDAQQVMQALAATVGDRPDLEPVIRLSGKSTIKGNELTISDSINVQSPGGNLSADDAMTRLAEWLTTNIKAGKIPL